MSDRGTSGTHTPIALFATWETALEDVKRRLRDWLVPIAPNQSSETELVRQWSMFGVDYWLKDPLNPERQLSAREVLVELVRESDASIR